MSSNIAYSFYNAWRTRISFELCSVPQFVSYTAPFSRSHFKSMSLLPLNKILILLHYAFALLMLSLKLMKRKINKKQYLMGREQRAQTSFVL